MKQILKIFEKSKMEPNSSKSYWEKINKIEKALKKPHYNVDYIINTKEEFIWETLPCITTKLFEKLQSGTQNYISGFWDMALLNISILFCNQKGKKFSSLKLQTHVI